MRSDRKAILSVMSIILVLSAIFLLQMARSHRRHLSAWIQHNVDESTRLVESNLSAAKTLYQSQLKHLTSGHSEIMEPFYRRDRQRLYDVTLPIFEEMKRRDPGFNNMHFHLPDGRSFLRVHEPDEYGDDLTQIRPMIARIHQDGVARDGYEFGVHGLFYRVAEPVVHEGRYVGALEFGIRPNVLVRNIEAVLDVEIALHATQPHEVGGNHAPATETGRRSLWTTGRGAIFARLSHEQMTRSSSSEVRTPEGRFCVYRAGEIHDAEGQSIGHLLIAQDISGQAARYHRLVWTSFLMVAGLVAAAYVILRLSFGHMIKRIVTLNETLERKVLERTEELTEQKRKVEATHAELAQIFETAAGGLRVIDTAFRTVRVNKTFKDMVGMDDAQIIGRPCHEVFPGPFCHTQECPLSRILHGAERVELEVEKVRTGGRVVPCLLTATPWRSPDGELLGFIEDFTDITTIKKLVEQQTINISLAQRILSFINGTCLRYADVDASMTLFFKALSATCHAAGGDHYFVRQLPADANHPAGRTVLSLKDQSGHEVNCVLKSIVTDLIHNTILQSAAEPSLAHEITRLNRYLTASSLFSEDEFITAVNVEIDHATGMLEYVSCGHPPFLVIRGREVFSFPDDVGPGCHLPLAFHSGIRFTADRFELQRGDKLIFCTDGLTEMPVAHRKERISADRMRPIVEGILRERPSICVSEIIARLLETVAQMSHERVVPGLENTSGDDVTLLGLELESLEADVEQALYISTVEDLCERVIESTDTIHAQAEREGFRLDRPQLRSVLDEALTNAWKHGNGCDGDKPVVLRWRFRNDLHIEVIDQGKGFDFHQLEDPTDGEHRVRDSGRGIFMIRLHADQVRWADEGRRLMLSFQRHTDVDRRKGKRIQKPCCLNIWQSSR